MQLPHLSGVESCCDGPTQFLAILPRVGQAGAHPFSQDVPFEFSKNSEQTGHRPTGGRRQIQRLPPHQHHIDFAAACRIQKLLPQLPLRGAATDLFDLHRNRPAPPGGVFA